MLDAKRRNKRDRQVLGAYMVKNNFTREQSKPGLLFYSVKVAKDFTFILTAVALESKQ